MSCEYCEKKAIQKPILETENISVYLAGSKLRSVRSRVLDNSGIEWEDIEFKYCPNCGQKLTDDEEK